MAPQQKPGRSRQDYRTPADFITAVKSLLGITEFAHDFAADATNTQAETFFDVRRDALSVGRWEYRMGLRDWGWLNPPFSNIAPWAAKCAETKRRGGHIAFLVPAGVGSNWFRDHVDGQAFVVMLNGRLAFMPDQPTWLYPKDCLLCVYSPFMAPGYEVWNWRQRLVAKAA